MYKIKISKFSKDHKNRISLTIADEKLNKCWLRVQEYKLNNELPIYEPYTIEKILNTDEE